MRVGIGCSGFGPGAEPEFIKTAAQTAERVGFATFWFGEHVLAVRASAARRLAEPPRRVRRPCVVALRPGHPVHGAHPRPCRPSHQLCRCAMHPLVRQSAGRPHYPRIRPHGLSYCPASPPGSGADYNPVGADGGCPWIASSSAPYVLRVRSNSSLNRLNCWRSSTVGNPSESVSKFRATSWSASSRFL